MTAFESRVANGPFAGKTLRESWHAMPAEWRGARHASLIEFPVLIKFIFPNDKLSIQVHPDDAYAAKYEQNAGGRGKTEMWHLVCARRGAEIMVGLRPGVNKEVFLQALAANTVENLLVHLPVQSGSTAVLRAMARTYTREEYLEKIALMKAAKRPISITTDMIVGFPGETERDFEETLSLLDEVQYDSVFAFKYSPRPNTPSLKMADAIPEEEKGRRLAILMDRQREIQRVRNERTVGETFEVLVDGKSRRENQWSGHTSSNRVVNFASPEQELLGDYVQVKVVSAMPNSLVGEMVGRVEFGNQ